MCIFFTFRFFNHRSTLKKVGARLPQAGALMICFLYFAPMSGLKVHYRDTLTPSQRIDSSTHGFQPSGFSYICKLIVEGTYSTLYFTAQTRTQLFSMLNKLSTVSSTVFFQSMYVSRPSTSRVLVTSIVDVLKFRASLGSGRRSRSSGRTS